MLASEASAAPQTRRLDPPSACRWIESVPLVEQEGGNGALKSYRRREGGAQGAELSPYVCGWTGEGGKNLKRLEEG